MTNNEYLEAVLCEQTLAPGSVELKALQERRKEVEAVLREEFGWAPRIRQGGSKAKGTMIRLSYDLDLTCYFGHEDGAVAGASLKDIYENVERVFSDRHYVTQRKGSAIRLFSADGRTDFHVDLVPGRFVDGEDGDVFLYRSSGDKERLKTNLDLHIAHVRNSGVVDAIRLMKLWRERDGIGVKTFVLELLVINLLHEKKRETLTGQLLHVWEKVREDGDGLTVEDPANPEGNDLSELFSDAVRAQLSGNAASTLRAIAQSGWQSVFGEVKRDEAARTAALTRIMVTTPIQTKPWWNGT